MNVFLQKQGDFWSKLLNSSSAKDESKAHLNKFSLEELEKLYDVLEKNPIVSETNKSLVVETIRNVAEFLIWGDQNEPRVFDFFLENNILAYLHRILLQPANRTGDVAKQVLQTLSIIIQNISSDTGLYFLFSNNHVNRIMTVPFDFNDEEVLGFFISFLKAISLKLSRQTSQFLINVGASGDLSFPLYTEAIKFAHHKEGMVRAGCRTMTLNIFSVGDPYIDTFVTRPPSTRYLTDLSSYLAKNIKILDQRMLQAEGYNSHQLSDLDSQLAEVEDVLSYCSDVLSAGHPFLTNMLAQQMWSTVVGPILLSSLLLKQHQQKSDPALSLTSPRTSAPSSSIQPSCALFVLERMFLLLEYSPFINNLALALFGRRSWEAEVCSRTAFETEVELFSGSSVPLGFEEPCCPSTWLISTLQLNLGVQQLASKKIEDANDASSSQVQQQHHPLEPSVCLEDSAPFMGDDTWYSSCREALTAILKAAGGSSRRALAASGALRMMVALSKSSTVSPVLLHALGLLPRSQAHQLLEECRGHASSGIPMGCVVCGLAGALADEGNRGRVTMAGGSSLIYCTAWTTCSPPELPAVVEEQVFEATNEEHAGDPMGGTDLYCLQVEVTEGKESGLEADGNVEGISAGVDMRQYVTSMPPDAPSQHSGVDMRQYATSMPPDAPSQHSGVTFLSADESSGLLGAERVMEGTETAVLGDDDDEDEDDEEEEPPVLTPEWSVKLEYVGQSQVMAGSPSHQQAEPVSLIDLEVEDIQVTPSLEQGPAAAEDDVGYDVGYGMTEAEYAKSVEAEEVVAVGNLEEEVAAVGNLEEEVAAVGNLEEEVVAVGNLEEEEGGNQADGISSREVIGWNGMSAKSSIQTTIPLENLLSLDEEGNNSGVLFPTPASGTDPFIPLPPPVPAPPAPSPLPPPALEWDEGKNPDGDTAPQSAAAQEIDNINTPDLLSGNPTNSGVARQAMPSLLSQEASGHVFQEGANRPGPIVSVAIEQTSVSLLSDQLLSGPSSSSQLPAATADPSSSSSQLPAATADPSSSSSQLPAATADPYSSSELIPTHASRPSTHVNTTPSTLQLQQSISPRSQSDLLGLWSSEVEGDVQKLEEANRSRLDREGDLVGIAGSGGVDDLAGARLLLQEPSPSLRHPQGEELRLRQELQSSSATPSVTPSATPSATPEADHTAVADLESSPLAHPLTRVGGLDLMNAIFTLLSEPMLPVTGIWNVTYLLGQVLCPEQGDLQGLSPSTPASAASSASKGLLLTAGQQAQLQITMDECVSRVLEEVSSSMWCDAVFPLICLEWPLAAEGAARPLLRASADVLMASPGLYPPKASEQSSTDSSTGRMQAAAAVAKMMGLSGSAAAALQVYHAVQRLVALLQLGQMVRVGSIDKAAPVPITKDWDQRNFDLSEGNQVELLPSQAIPCIVSFAPGQERRVYFSVAGAALPRLQAFATGGPAPDAEYVRSDERAAACLLHSSASVVLADPAPTRLNAGLVASLAPLMGCDTQVDKNVSKWLHVHVRPSVRGLLRVLRGVSGKKGGVIAAMRQLADGHWVLAFPDADRASTASLIARTQADRLRSCYSELLVTLITS